MTSDDDKEVAITSDDDEEGSDIEINFDDRAKKRRKTQETEKGVMGMKFMRAGEDVAKEKLKR